MKNHIVLFLVTVFMAVLVMPKISQAQDQKITREELDQFSNFSSIVPTKSAKEVIGSPYLTDKFLKGRLIINKNSVTRPIYLRYNTYKNDIEFLRNKKIMITDPKKIQGFKIFTKEDGDIVFENGFNTKVNDISKKTFLRVIHDGKTKLLAHHYSTYLEDMASYGTATKKDRYQSSVRYYLVTNDGKFRKVKFSKKDILEALPDHKSEVESYADSQNLSFDDEADIAKILSYYDGLPG